jgi:hypothetical protein
MIASIGVAVVGSVEVVAAAQCRSVAAAGETSRVGTIG